MAKKLTNNGNNGIVTVGLDIGYGVTKLVANGSAVITFPSVVAYSREIKFRADEIAAKYPGDQIMDDDGAWFVGDLALSQSPNQLLRLRGRTARENLVGNVFRLRLAKVALGKLFPGQRNGEVVHLRIATGLPVDHMRDAGELKAALIGQHLVQTDTTQFVANIVDVMVMPQPYGTIYSKMLTEKGEINPCHTATRTGVVDVGTYTIDVTLDDDGEYIDSQSGSAESGVHLAQEALTAALERDYREKPTYKVVESVLRTGHFKAHGQPVSYAHEVQEALEPIRAHTLGLMAEKWQSGFNVDVIYLSGGGAELVYKQVKESYSQTLLLPESQLANARGYLYYARFAASQE